MAVRNRKTKNTSIEFRCTEEQESMVKKAADLSHKSVSAFVLESVLAEAEQVLAKQTVFKLTAEEWEVFNNALSRPAKVIPELVELFGQSHEWDDDVQTDKTGA